MKENVEEKEKWKKKKRVSVTCAVCLDCVCGFSPQLASLPPGEYSAL